MALKEYIGLARLTQAFSLLKSKLDGKEDTPTVISYDDFMALTPQQQTSGYYLVVGGTPMTNAYGISYQSNKTVGDALDDHADAISELNADLMELSNVKYASWKNTEVSGSGQGSNTLTLSNGTYLVIGQAPYTDVEYTACIKTDDSSQVYIAEQSGKNLINMSTIFKVTNGSTHVWVANYSSATITYQDISKGYIKAIRVGD